MYEDSNSTNHHLTANTLDLTAVANRGGVTPGGISSGQIVTNERFYPRNGKTYVFALRAKIPHSHGTTGTWLYAASDPHTSSEIDIFEFFDKGTKFTWVGNDPEVLINRAIGGSDNVNATAATFPAVYSIDSFKVYV